MDTTLKQKKSSLMLVLQRTSICFLMADGKMYIRRPFRLTVNGLVRFCLKFIYAHISSEPGLIFCVALAGTEKQIDGGRARTSRLVVLLWI